MTVLDNDAFASWLADQGDPLWTYAMLPVVGMLGIYFMLRTGAVRFRMWTMALIGGASGCVESTLAQMSKGLNPTFTRSQLPVKAAE